MDALRVRMEQMKEFFQTLPDKHQKALSGAAQNLMHVAKEWDQMEERMREASQRLGQLRQGSLTSGLSGAKSEGASSDSSKLIRVSDPGNDFAFSVLAGFTQSETSTAWCGNNVVVGFNDSGSLPESIFFGPGGVSFNGVARSTDMGESFVDLGFLNPSPNFFDLLVGDPVLGCVNVNTVYYSSLFETGTPLAPLSAISVSISSNGGATFGNPVVTASKDAFTHFLDKEWMAVDPTNPNRLFVTYTDSPRCTSVYEPESALRHLHRLRFLGHGVRILRWEANRQNGHRASPVHKRRCNVECSAGDRSDLW